MYPVDVMRFRTRNPKVSEREGAEIWDESPDISAHFKDNILSVSAGHFSVVLTNLECHTNTRLADFAMQTKRGVIYVVLFSMGVVAC